MKRINRTITLALATGIFFTTEAMALEIKQQEFIFDMTTIQIAESDTFVICEGSTSITKLSESCRMLMVYFQKGSAKLTPGAAQEIITKIQKSGVLPNTSLVITGYSCELGTTKNNQALSYKRAKTIADILEGHGYSTNTVQGKGTQNPITNIPQEFYRNRRVEIEIMKMKQIQQEQIPQEKAP